MRPVIKEVIKGEEIYPGLVERVSLPHKHLPDLLALANPGFELKSVYGKQELYSKSVFNGMHTFNDAFILSKGRIFPEQRLNISELKKYILTYFDR